MIEALTTYLVSKGFSAIHAEAEAMRLCCDCGERFAGDGRCPHCRSDETIPVEDMR